MADKNFKVKTGLSLPSPLSVDQGGTGQTSAANTLNALLPLQTSNSNKVLQTDGTNTTWTTLPTGYTKGATGSRPGSPAAGDLYFNTDNNYFESYTTNGWFPIAAAPGVPTSVVATDTPSGRAHNNGRASVAFSLASGAGAPTSLTITPSPATSPTTFTGSSSPIIVTGLASSTSYTYTVSATSPYGTSAASAASAGVTATSVPQAPTIGAVTAGNALATVAYTAGATGGSAVTTYTATSNPGSFTGTGASPITVSGLTNGTSYTFTVSATNANGTSAASAASSAVSPSAFVLVGAYDSIATATIVNGTTQTITFSSIPATYTHLQLRYIVRTDRTDDYADAIGIRFNSDTGSNYYRHRFETEGAGGAVGGTSTGTDAQYHVMGATALCTSNVFASGVVDILDYANTSKNKTTKSLSGVFNANAQNWMGFEGSMWNSTAAVNTIALKVNYGTYYSIGSTIALYGIKGA